MLSPRWTLLAASLAALVIGWPLLTQIYYPARWPLDVAQHAIGRDFVNVWVGGRLLLEGNWATLFDVRAYIAALHRMFDPALPPHFWSYPPSNFPFVVPFALLPYGLALAVWTIAGLAAYAAAAGIGLTRDVRVGVLLLLAIAPATLVNVICGQNGFFTAALLAGGVLLLDRRPMVAGVLIGLLAYKPHFGIVLAPALLAIGAWRSIGVAAATAAGVALLSVAIFGIGPWQAFFRTTMPNQAAMLSAFEGFFTTMLVSPYASLRHLGAGHGPAMGLQVALAVLVIGSVAWAVRGEHDPDRRLALIGVGTFLASPYTLTYDLPIIALVIARMATQGGTEGRWPAQTAVILGAAWALPLASPMLTAFGVPIAPPAIAALLILSLQSNILDPRGT
jgi:hypothetical protein